MCGLEELASSFPTLHFRKHHCPSLSIPFSVRFAVVFTAFYFITPIPLKIKYTKIANWPGWLFLRDMLHTPSFLCFDVDDNQMANASQDVDLIAWLHFVYKVMAYTHGNHNRQLTFYGLTKNFCWNCADIHFCRLILWAQELFYSERSFYIFNPDKNKRGYRTGCMIQRKKIDSISWYFPSFVFFPGSN